MLSDLVTNIWPVFRSLSRVDQVRYGVYCFTLAISNFFDFVGIVAMSLLAINLIYSPGQSPSIFYDGLGFAGDTFRYSITFLTCVIIVSFILKSIIGVTFIKLLFHFLANRATELSKRLYKSILEDRRADFNEKSSQDVAVLLTNGIQAAVVDSLGYLAIAFSEMILIAIISLLLISLMPISALAVIVYFGSIVFGLNRFISAKTKINEKITIENYTKALELIQETRNLKKEIVLSDKVDYFGNIFENVYDKRSKTLSYLQILGLLPKYILEAFLIFGVALFALIGLLLGDGRSLATEIMLIITASARVLPAFLRFQASLLQVSRSFALTTEVNKLMKFELLKEEIAKYDILGSKSKEVIVVQNLSFTYPNSEIPILKNLNFEIEENSIFAIKGRSGTGKTTLINLIMGFLTPTGGDIYFKTLDQSSRKGIALVSQESKFLNATILENIALGEHPETVSIEKIFEALEEANIYHEVNNLPKGLYENLGENSSKFSGGQRQRLIIARAIYTESKILIFDEPTSSLDQNSTTSFIELIKRLAQNRTIVVVTHDTRIMNCADMVLTI